MKDHFLVHVRHTRSILVFRSSVSCMPTFFLEFSLFFVILCLNLDSQKGYMCLAMSFNTHILFSLILSVFVIDTVCSVRNSSVSYSDSFVLSCGTTSSSDDSNGRNWIPDSPFLTSSNNSFVATAQSQDPSLPSTVPYMTARIFSSESTYTFSLSSDPDARYWIRLHFYPSSYDTFNCSNSFFAVTANEYTLLSNFSAAITAEALTQAYIIREYSLRPIQHGILNLTFTPSLIYEGAFAFINGIEIISMPSIFHSAQMVGFGGQIIYPGSNTLETMYRLNVGGQYVSPNEDSGLTRTWYDDSPYLFGAASGVASEADPKVPILYPKDLPKYVAPADVYRTARSMGPDPHVNKNYNLTWLFQVDANYSYLVRFHFCDYINSRINERVFAIYINNQTAFPYADVVGWTHGMGVPMYKDFAVYVRDQSENNEIWVALHPNVSSKPANYDAILNGLEIFKISDTKGNLSGPNPVPSAMLVQAMNKPLSSSKSNDHGLVIGLVVGAVAVLGLVFGVIFFVQRRKNSGNRDKSCGVGWLPVYSTSGTKSTSNSLKSTGSSRLSTPGGGLCRRFSLAEIRLATNNFDESQVIGVGGFGKVFKGVIDGRTKVAIKRSNPSSEQGIHEFNTEIDLLSKLRHRHLVSLIGACEENEEMILVYDYMANGTLREHLNERKESPLSWIQRLNICIGAARGLHYLHTGAKHTIIHRDVKTTNILLDEKWVAKVSDFGLSKAGTTLNQTHVSTIVKGSFGYLDPEYFRRQQLTDKSDVYSFGVVLFEVLCGRPPINPTLPKEQVSLSDWALECHKNGTLEDLIDPHIKGEIYSESLKTFINVAVICLSDQGIDRPSMGAVLWNLEYALQLQNNPDGPKNVAEQKANDAYAMYATLISIAEESESETQSSTVFSQILNPQGR